jgi:branched-chain amino acid transport system ATP-binding protein
MALLDEHYGHFLAPEFLQRSENTQLENLDLLLMDEPTEGLAPLPVRDLSRAIFSLKQFGTSILLIEQQLAFALR